MLIHDNHITTTDAETGELLTEHDIDETRDYQKPLQTNPRQQ